LQDNLATSFNVLKVAAPALAEGGGGSIACVGAAVVHYGMKNHEAWAAAKGAVEGELTAGFQRRATDTFVSTVEGENSCRSSL
jgi:NAD(P)-dependent dehydrogenase (short-subunit alcohol dehydrogenase family)